MISRKVLCIVILQAFAVMNTRGDTADCNDKRVECQAEESCAECMSAISLDAYAAPESCDPAGFEEFYESLIDEEECGEKDITTLFTELADCISESAAADCHVNATDPCAAELTHCNEDTACSTCSIALANITQITAADNVTCDDAWSYLEDTVDSNCNLDEGDFHDLIVCTFKESAIKDCEAQTLDGGASEAGILRVGTVLLAIAAAFLVLI